MGKVRVYTAQHVNMWKELKETGRYYMKRRYVSLDMIEHQKIMQKIYEWLATHMPNPKGRPAPDALPIWVAFEPSGAQADSPDVVTLELELDEEEITKINIAKWGTIMNYSYIPKDKADDKRHQQMLSDYGIDDAKAVMTPFYPMVRREVENSWVRLFDDNIILEGTGFYGVIREVTMDMVVNVTEGLKH